MFNMLDGLACTSGFLLGTVETGNQREHIPKCHGYEGSFWGLWCCLERQASLGDECCPELWQQYIEGDI